MYGKEITALRNSLGLTQIQFADLMHVHPMTVSKWERGVGGPDEYQKALLADFKKAARDKEVQKTLEAVLIGAGIVAAIYLLLNTARKGK